MMIKIVEIDPDHNTIGGIMLVDRDSISAVYGRAKNVQVCDYDENGKAISGTWRRQDVEYTEILLKNGHRLQTVIPVNTIYELVNG